LWLPGLPLSLPRHPFGHEDFDGLGACTIEKRLLYRMWR
jgi:hypothetical protein